MSAAGLVLAVILGGLIARGAWAWRPAPARVRALMGGSGAGRPPGELAQPRPPARSWGATTLLGRALRARLRRPPDPVADRHLGRALLLAVPATLLSPPLVLVVALWWWAAPQAEARRTRRRQDQVVRDELPEVVDLFVLAIGAGLTVHLAVTAVARHARGRIAAGLREVSRRVALGAPLADALVVLPTTAGDRVRPLVTVLASSDRYGVALLPALERLAGETRLERRRAAEAAARRIPVKLLFPLVLCTLPAFALLTVVPLLAGSLRSLRL